MLDLLDPKQAYEIFRLQWMIDHGYGILDFIKNLEAMIEEARVVYGGRRYTPRWAEMLLVGYALICYGVSLLYHAQDSVMEGGRTDVW